MNHRGWVGGVVRPPLQPLTRGQSEELAEVLNSTLATGKPDRGNATRRPCLVDCAEGMMKCRISTWPPH